MTRDEPIFYLPTGPKRLSELTLDDARAVIEMLMDSYERQRQAFASYREVDALCAAKGGAL